MKDINNMQFINSKVDINTDLFYNWSSKIIKDELFEKELLKVLTRIALLYKTKTIFPIYNNIFRAFKETSIEDCEYVLLGMDPYHNEYRAKPSACGLSFVTENGYINPSLRILLNSLKLNTPEEFYNLMINEKKVLMLNTSFTVEKGKPGSHIKFWENISQKLIMNISKECPKLKWILLGREAQKYRSFVVKGEIYTAPHPASYIYRKGVSTLELDILFKKLNWIK